MTLAEAQTELRAFVSKNAGEGDDIDSLLAAIESSIERFAGDRDPPRLEVRDQAKRLADAARKYQTAVRVFDNAIKGAEACWPFLAMTVSSPGRPPIPYSEARGRALVASDGLNDVRDIELAAMATAKRLTGGNLGRDDRRTMLGWAFFDFYYMVTGLRPAFSKSDTVTFEKPGTKFGNFVRLCLLASPHFADARIKGVVGSFRSFIEDAVERGNALSPFGTRSQEKKRK